MVQQLLMPASPPVCGEYYEISKWCMSEPAPMLSMLEWLCAQLMEAEVSGIVGAEKNVRSSSRSHGYIPFFVTERKRSEAALQHQSIAFLDVRQKH